MTATVFTAGKFRAFTVDGSGPLSGGMVYWYKAGTTTAQDTYTDSTGTVANPNPVILDTSGKADIWLGNLAYKYVLKDASGTTIETEDNITGIQFSAAFTATSTSNLTIGTGLKTFIIDSGKAFTNGQYLIATETVDSNGYYMIGQVQSYVGTNLVLNVSGTLGSGTFAAWNISLSGPGASDASLTTSDITTNDASTAKHGFLPKLPGNTTTYLRGDGLYAPLPAGVSAASQSDERTATSTAVYTSPGTQQYHPSSLKAWASFVGSTGAINASYNISSISRTAVGLYVVTFVTSFADTFYTLSGSVRPSTGNAANGIVNFTSATKSSNSCTVSVTVTNTGTGLADFAEVYLNFFGNM